MAITTAQFRQAFPKCANPDGWAVGLDGEMDKAKINTPARVAAFLAQLSHESSRFTLLEENLNYKTPSRLDAMFSAVTSEADARALIARGPQAIGNRVYANRNGNGDERSGDGWRYRGMGAIQLTGKANYLKTGQRIGEDLVNHPELLLTPRVGAKAAVAYWVRCDLNDEADREDHIEITRAINGNALAGLAERRTEYRRLRSLWG